MGLGLGFDLILKDGRHGEGRDLSTAKGGCSEWPACMEDAA